METWLLSDVIGKFNLKKLYLIDLSNSDYQSLLLTSAEFEMHFCTEPGLQILPLISQNRIREGSLRFPVWREGMITATLWIVHVRVLFQDRLKTMWTRPDVPLQMWINNQELETGYAPFIHYFKLIWTYIKVKYQHTVNSGQLPTAPMILSIILLLLMLMKLTLTPLVLLSSPLYSLLVYVVFTSYIVCAFLYTIWDFPLWN